MQSIYLEQASGMTIATFRSFMRCVISRSEHFHQSCGDVQRRRSESGLFGFWLRFGSVTGFFKPAPSPKPRQNPKILAPHRYIFSVNALALFAGICLSLLGGAAVQCPAAQFNLLHGFAGGPADGAKPQFGSLATDGTTLYGFTFNGGSADKGVLFKINPDGSGYEIVHFFAGLSFADVLLGGSANTNDGAYPSGTPLLIGSTIYGMSQSGGTNGTGAIFKINTDGSGLEVLHSFGAGLGPADGYSPYSSLVTDGTSLYGMTYSSVLGRGIIFSIGIDGSDFTTLYNFNATAGQAANPQGSLTLSGSTLYGLTLGGGANGLGIIFEIQIDGAGYQVLHNFTGASNDGASPYGSLIISDSTLYGMTSAGGANKAGTVFTLQNDGSGFQVLHSFSAPATQPMGDLVLSNETLFGMTAGTNVGNIGTLFQINTDGSGFQVDHTFSFAANNLSDGSKPEGSLLLSGSKFYGMTQLGGSSHNIGALFVFDPNGTQSGGGGAGSTGALRVNLLPADVAKAGAQWLVDGAGASKSGAVFAGLSAGPHIITFSTVKGWATPAAQVVNVTADATNTISGTYTLVDVTKPTLKVLAPKSGQQVNNAIFTATGTASDNVGVAQVNYQLNGGAWTAATTANGWVNWSATNLNLLPGANVIKFYAQDTSTNVSITNTISFTYVVSAPLTVNINGGGTVSPDLNGQLLEIGKTFTMTAKASKGSAFVDWTGSATTTSTKLSFVMASNLTFTANFKDIARPVNAILSPTKGQTFTNTVAKGRAMDNVGVVSVSFQVNGGAWTPANLLDGTNWTTPDLSSALLSGANTISAYAMDAAGNASLTNTIAFNFAVRPIADWAPDTLNGLLATVTPNSGSPESVGFDLTTFAQKSTTNSLNPQDNGGGTYNYLKVDTNLAQLALFFSALPGNTNSVGPIDLIFTNHYSGYFSNEVGGDVGGITLQVATSFVPTSVVGKTLTAVSTVNAKTIKIKMSNAVAFTKTPANNSSTGSSSGLYSFTRLSPVGSMFFFSFTDPADSGQTAYVQTTFTTSTSGSYFTMVFDSLGQFQDVDSGEFTMK